jgi:hypothetical protein
MSGRPGFDLGDLFQEFVLRVRLEWSPTDQQLVEDHGESDLDGIVARRARRGLLLSTCHKRMSLMKYRPIFFCRACEAARYFPAGPGRILVVLIQFLRRAVS